MTSTLTDIALPFGADFTVDPRVVDRAKREDLNHAITYEIRFFRNSRGQVILDRRYNTAALMAMYYGKDAPFIRGITWNKDDPNDLSLALPSGGTVSTRVTRRSEEQPADQRIETSEYLRQTFQTSMENVSSKVKASQCFTKYKWRSAVAAAGRPEIVATQVVSDYLTAFDDESKFMRSMGKAVTIYTYQMSFQRLQTPSLDFMLS